MDLYKTIGSASYDNLLADPQGADKIAIPCEPGNGALDKGTLMYRKSSGLWAPAESGQVSTSYMLAVLDEDLDTGSAVEPGSAAPDAGAYRAGRFIAGKVHLANNGTVTDAHKVVLNLMGIVFDQAEGEGTFDNSTVTITYNPNNGTTEAAVAVGAVKGSSYAILNNSADILGFTAPATKSFSKWNTKADGSGTDYAAAASYTANADLVLYAVWA